MNSMTLPPVIVCVRDAAHSRLLLNHAQQLAQKEHRPLTLLSVHPSGETSGETARFVQQMYDTAKEYGAELNLVFNEHPVMAAAAYIRRTGATIVVTGKPEDNSNNFINGLRKLLPQITIAMVADYNMLYCVYPACTADLHRCVG